MKNAKVLSFVLASAMLLAAAPGLPVLAATDDEGTGETGVAEDLGSGSEGEKYTVSFVTGGRYEMDPDEESQLIPSGSLVSIPGSPAYIDMEGTKALDYEESGMTFFDWYVGGKYFESVADIFGTTKEGGKRYDFETPVTSDLQLTAVSQCTYTVYICDVSGDGNTGCGKVNYLCGANPYQPEEIDDDFFYGEDTIKIKGSFMAIENTTVSLVAYAEEGYSFLGWSSSEDPDDIFNRSPYYFDHYVTKGVTAYALFEKTHPVTVTVNYFSIDGTTADPVEFTVDSGITLEEALITYLQDNEISNFFPNDGYSKVSLFTFEPVSEFDSTSEITDFLELHSSDSYFYGGAFDYALSEDIEVYCNMLVPVTSVSANVISPLAGSGAEDEEADITVAGTGYEVDTYQKDDEEFISAFWYEGEIENDTEIFTGTFEEGETYSLNMWFVVKPGYAFVLEDDSVSINGSKASLDYNSYDYCNITASLVAEKESVAAVEGDGSIYTIGSTDPLRFVYKFTRKNADTFKMHTETLIDGKAIPATIKDKFGNDVPTHEAKEGSLILNVYPVYLDTLSVGEHTLTVKFSNGLSISSKFEVKAAAAVPASGESNSSSMISGIILITASLMGAGAYVVSNKRRSARKDAE